MCWGIWDTDFWSWPGGVREAFHRQMSGRRDESSNPGLLHPWPVLAKPFLGQVLGQLRRLEPERPEPFLNPPQEARALRQARTFAASLAPLGRRVVIFCHVVGLLFCIVFSMPFWIDF